MNPIHHYKSIAEKTIKYQLIQYKTKSTIYITHYKLPMNPHEIQDPIP